MENFENNNIQENNLPQNDNAVSEIENTSDAVEPMSDNFDNSTSSEIAEEPAVEFGNNSTESVDNGHLEESGVEAPGIPIDNQVGILSDTPENGEPISEKIEFNTESSKHSAQSSSKGIRVFAGILAAVLLITVSCAVGYNFGKQKISTNSVYSSTSMKVYPKPADTKEMTAQEVYDKVSPSVVGIIAYNTEGDAAQASGVVYTDNEYILTNDHIYANIPSAKFKVYTATGKSYDAEYVAGDTISDLALIKVKGASDLKKPEFGDSTQTSFGENVVAIGRPGDARATSSITTGVISNPNRRANITTNYSVNMLQTDCDIFEGSSGGALVNMYGQVIGITSSKSVADEGAAMNFAIPVKTVSRFAPQLSSKGKVVDRAKLGISYREVSSLEAELNKSKYYGLYITEISVDSDLSGKVKDGSMITHINGKAITSPEIVLNTIDDSKADDIIKLTIVDADGNTNDYSVKLKANIGESSYTTERANGQELPSGNGSGQPGDKTFNFPDGE